MLVKKLCEMVEFPEGESKKEGKGDGKRINAYYTNDP